MPEEREYEIAVTLDNEDGYAEATLTVVTTTRRKALKQAQALLNTLGSVTLELDDVPEDDD